MKRYGLLLLGLSATLAGQSPAGASFPAPAEAERTVALAAIRDYALHYTQRLPDYTCIQETRWTVNSPGEFPRSGVSETQLGYVGHKELVRLITINGVAAIRVKSGDFPAVVSRGEFGNLLERIFDPAIPVNFGWARWDMIGGRRMNVFAYRVPKEHGYIIRERRGEATVAFGGLIYADADTGAVMRIELQSADFPPASTYRELKLTLNYKPTLVASREFVLPSDFKEDFRRSNFDTQQFGTSTAQFTRYRRFTADAKIKF